MKLENKLSYFYVEILNYYACKVKKPHKSNSAEQTKSLSTVNQFFYCSYVILRWLKTVSLFLNTNSLIERYYHNLSFASLKRVSKKCPVIAYSKF